MPTIFSRVSDCEVEYREKQQMIAMQKGMTGSQQGTEFCGGENLCYGGEVGGGAS